MVGSRPTPRPQFQIMKTFYTVTDQKTEATNSRSTRSKRFTHLTGPGSATAEAESRVRGGVEGVFILQAIQLVTLKTSIPPVEILTLEP